MTKVWTMSEAAGVSARAIRQAAGATLAEVAKAARFLGLPWSSGRVGDFESGRIAPSLPTLIAVAGALSEVVQEKTIGLVDLFDVEGDVRINDELTLSAEKLRAILGGEPFQVVLGDMPNSQEFLFEGIDHAKLSMPEELRHQMLGVVIEFAEGDERFARSLGLDKLTAAAAMTRAWGQTFVKQRDDLAGPNANAQKKGIVTRQLKNELKAVIDGNNK